MPRTSYAGVTADWETLLVTVAANAQELGHLEAFRAQLATLHESTKAAILRQSIFKAQLQQSTRDLEQHLAQGTDLATRLRNGIRAQYGLRGEKLTEFGLQPRRKPQKKAPEPVRQPAPEATTDAVKDSDS